LELLATYSTEKSLTTKLQVSAAKASSMNSNWPKAAGRATAIQAGRLGRHVVLVVLGQHFVGDEHPVGVQATLGDGALPFGEQIGKDAGVAHGHVVRVVGDHEGDGQRLAALQGARLDQATDADHVVSRRLAFHHLGGREEIGHVAAQRLEYQHRGGSENGQPHG